VAVSLEQRRRGDARARWWRREWRLRRCGGLPAPAAPTGGALGPGGGDGEEEAPGVVRTGRQLRIEAISRSASYTGPLTVCADVHCHPIRPIGGE
jgi:hypothetical protein